MPDTMDTDNTPGTQANGIPPAPPLPTTSGGGGLTTTTGGGPHDQPTGTARTNTQARGTQSESSAIIDTQNVDDPPAASPATGGRNEEQRPNDWPNFAEIADEVRDVRQALQVQYQMMMPFLTYNPALGQYRPQVPALSAVSASASQVGGPSPANPVSNLGFIDDGYAQQPPLTGANPVTTMHRPAVPAQPAYNPRFAPAPPQVPTAPSAPLGGVPQYPPVSGVQHNPYMLPPRAALMANPGLYHQGMSAPQPPPNVMPNSGLAARVATNSGLAA